MGYPTKLDGIVACKERKRANNGGKSGALPVRYDAHGYARRIHAQVGSRALGL
jgi:hypothetical protein